MCFKLSKKQIIILIVFSLIGAILGYLSAPTYFCEVYYKHLDSSPLCAKAPKLEYTFYGIFIFGIVTYFIEVIYNYFNKGNN
mgnify:CR=1 FL=1